MSGKINEDTEYAYIKMATRVKEQAMEIGRERSVEGCKVPFYQVVYEAFDKGMLDKPEERKGEDITKFNEFYSEFDFCLDDFSFDNIVRTRERLKKTDLGIEQLYFLEECLFHLWRLRNIAFRRIGKWKMENPECTPVHLRRSNSPGKPNGDAGKRPKLEINEDTGYAYLKIATRHKRHAMEIARERTKKEGCSVPYYVVFHEIVDRGLPDKPEERREKDITQFCDHQDGFDLCMRDLLIENIDRTRERLIKAELSVEELDYALECFFNGFRLIYGVTARIKEREKNPAPGEPDLMELLSRKHYRLERAADEEHKIEFPEEYAEDPKKQFDEWFNCRRWNWSGMVGYKYWQ